MSARGVHFERARIEVAERLQLRRPEIENATLTRVYALADATEGVDSEYRHGLRAAVAAALDYGLAGLRRSEEGAPPIPAVLLAQARLAARRGISLDTVLRRYLAGYTLLGDFVIHEAEASGLLRGAELKRLLRSQAALFDRLMAGIGDEYTRAERTRLGTAAERRADRLRRLLDGELLDVSDLGYDFDAHHLGILAVGSGADDVLAALAESVGRRLLVVRNEEGAVWGWLSFNSLEPQAIDQCVDRPWPAGVSVAFGEPGEGLAGWRVTHRQARAALPIVLMGGGGAIRYADVALIASMLRDDLLLTSLRQLYLAPLSQERDGGETARETLRAYFATGRQVSSAAAALGVNRHTVTNRLRAIEERLGRPLETCTAEMDAALRLDATLAGQSF